MLHTSEHIQAGDKVLILRPAYVVGKVGVVCGWETPKQNQSNKRWLIQITSEPENILVSIVANDFLGISRELYS